MASTKSEKVFVFTGSVARFGWFSTRVTEILLLARESDCTDADTGYCLCRLGWWLGADCHRFCAAPSSGSNHGRRRLSSHSEPSILVQTHLSRRFWVGLELRRRELSAANSFFVKRWGCDPSLSAAGFFAARFDDLEPMDIVHVRLRRRDLARGNDEDEVITSSLGFHLGFQNNLFLGPNSLCCFRWRSNVETDQI